VTCAAFVLNPVLVNCFVYGNKSLPMAKLLKFYRDAAITCPRRGMRDSALKKMHAMEAEND
jgi:hypothetical protein